jgi:hypothetical protein
MLFFIVYLTGMSESDLHKLSLDELFELMMKSTKELVDLTHTLSKVDYDDKTAELQLIQRAIVAKKGTD